MGTATAATTRRGDSDRDDDEDDDDGERRRENDAGRDAQRKDWRKGGRGMKPGGEPE
jgi:hypothetical protein